MYDGCWEVKNGKREGACGVQLHEHAIEIGVCFLFDALLCT